MEMVKQTSAAQHTTHTVFNQPPLLVDYNVFTQDRALVECVQREGADWALDVLRALTKEPQALETFFEELAPARKADTRLDAAIRQLQSQLTDREALEW